MAAVMLILCFMVISVSSFMAVLFHNILRLIDDGSDPGYVHEEKIKYFARFYAHRVHWLDQSFIEMNQTGIVSQQS